MASVYIVVKTQGTKKSYTIKLHFRRQVYLQVCNPTPYFEQTRVILVTAEKLQNLGQDATGNENC